MRILKYFLKTILFLDFTPPKGVAAFVTKVKLEINSFNCKFIYFKICGLKKPGHIIVIYRLVLQTAFCGY